MSTSKVRDQIHAIVQEYGLVPTAKWLKLSADSLARVLADQEVRNSTQQVVELKVASGTRPEKAAKPKKAKSGETPKKKKKSEKGEKTGKAKVKKLNKAARAARA